MTGKLVLYMLTCGPLVLTLAAWTKLYRGRQRQWPDAFALLALSIVSANTVFAAGTFLYYQFKPTPTFLPPWKDPQILTLGLLFLLAPIGMILGIVAGVHGAPKWLICTMEIASLPLLVVGIMAGSAV
jgi:hypothetical protein